MNGCVTRIVDKETTRAIWQNARWFTHYYYRCKEMKDGKYAVTTNYPWIWLDPLPKK